MHHFKWHGRWSCSHFCWLLLFFDIQTINCGKIVSFGIRFSSFLLLFFKLLFSARVYCHCCTLRYTQKIFNKFSNDDICFSTEKKTFNFCIHCCNVMLFSRMGMAEIKCDDHICSCKLFFCLLQPFCTLCISTGFDIVFFFLSKKPV